jgi:NAD(P)-dependent dehydrogenase (short-subunit alcohol dehydrogenase family)
MEKPEIDFDGRAVLITGCNRNRPRTALVFAAARAAVIIGDVDPLAKPRPVTSSRTGGKAVFQKTDVSDSDQVQALVARAVSESADLTPRSTTRAYCRRRRRSPSRPRSTGTGS